MTKSATVTVVMYLSDGDANIFFPKLGLKVAPKAGMALTWLNILPDGSPNQNAIHGVQAMPKDGSLRMAVGYRITFSDEEIMAHHASFVGNNVEEK